MSNEPNKAPNAPASDAANQSAKTANTKPEVIVTPAPAADAPIEPKTS